MTKNSRNHYNSFLPKNYSEIIAKPLIFPCYCSILYSLFSLLFFYSSPISFCHLGFSSSSFEGVSSRGKHGCEHGYIMNHVPLNSSSLKSKAQHEHVHNHVSKKHRHVLLKHEHVSYVFA